MDWQPFFEYSCIIEVSFSSAHYSLKLSLETGKEFDTGNHRRSVLHMNYITVV